MDVYTTMKLGFLTILGEHNFKKKKYYCIKFYYDYKNK